MGTRPPFVREASAVVLGTVLLGVVAAAVGLQGVFWNGDFLHDDAFITLRYAQNWIAGNGIGWNPGDRVEGYTNLLPNTWWVKGAEPSVWRIGAGVRYLSAFLFEPPFPVLFMIAGAIRAARAGHLTRAERFGLAVVGLHLAWVVYVGGDQMPLYRLLVPILPVAVWLAWSSWLPDLRRIAMNNLASYCTAHPRASGRSGNIQEFIHVEQYVAVG